MQAALGALVMIGGGAAFLYAAVRGWRTGELRAGSRGFSTYRPRRDTEPGAFHFFLVLYLAMGAAGVGYGVLMAVGAVPPLPLR